MAFDIFINFNGECNEALSLYSKVFKSDVIGLMTYGQLSPDPNYAMSEEDKDKVMYSCIPIFGCNVMFSDIPFGTPLVKGNNISLTIGTKDIDEVRRIFHDLSVGGIIEKELQQTIWSDLYGSVTDRFGIKWQLSHDSGKIY